MPVDATEAPKDSVIRLLSKLPGNVHLKISVDVTALSSSLMPFGFFNQV
jgi:hypothetical protein